MKKSTKTFADTAFSVGKAAEDRYYGEKTRLLLLLSLWLLLLCYHYGYCCCYLLHNYCLKTFRDLNLYDIKIVSTKWGNCPMDQLNLENEFHIWIDTNTVTSVDREIDIYVQVVGVLVLLVQVQAVVVLVVVLVLVLVIYSH